MSNRARLVKCSGWAVIAFLMLSWPSVLGDETAHAWTRFRGAEGSGHSAATTVPASFTEKDYNWRIELPGSGHSSPVVFGDAVFVTAVDSAAGKRRILCVDAATGKQRWVKERSFETHGQHRLNSFASATPALDDQRVYVAWTTGTALEVIALDHAGAEVWSRVVGSHSARHGSAVSPVVVDDVLIVANDNEGEESCLLGLDSGTGETRWKLARQTSRAAYSTPAVWQREGGDTEVLFASTSHGLTSVDPATGKVIWEVADLFKHRCVASPVVGDGLVFLCAGSGGGGKDSAVIALPDGKKTAEVAYRLDKGLPYVPTGVAHGPHFFLWADGGIVSCVEAATGKQVWQQRVGGKFYGSPICVDGKLYCVDTDGTLVVLRAGATFEELGRVKLGEASHATPAVAGGVLYLRTERHLISVGGKRDGA